MDNGHLKRSLMQYNEKIRTVFYFYFFIFLLWGEEGVIKIYKTNEERNLMLSGQFYS